MTLSTTFVAKQEDEKSSVSVAVAVHPEHGGRDRVALV